MKKKIFFVAITGDPVYFRFLLVYCDQLALAGLGRHEEAIVIWDELFDIARELGQNPRGLLNYSSLAYRELYDLTEARNRSEQALELSAGQSFGMPRSPISQVTWCADSGDSVQKSHCMSWSRRLLLSLRF